MPQSEVQPDGLVRIGQSVVKSYKAQVDSANFLELQSRTRYET